MRTIKFRGKRTDNGEWAYGWYFNDDSGEGITHFIKDEKTLLDEEVILETVGQYAELLDINRKEIYEGDITENEAGKRFQVRWGINSNGFIAQTRDVHSNVYSSYHLVPKTKWVGTIHDNPEMWR